MVALLLLARVVDFRAADAACRSGVDIVELASPGGEPPRPEVVAGIVADLQGRCAVSALLCEPSHKGQALATAEALVGAGVAYLRVALTSRSESHCFGSFAGLAARTRLLAQWPATSIPSDQAIRALAEVGFAGAMLAAEGRLLGTSDDLPHLKSFVDTCHRHGLLAGLEGLIEEPDIPRLLLTGPDILGLHGACKDIDAEALRRICDLVRAPAADAAGRAGARHGRRSRLRPGPTGEPATDVVFVHDFIIPARVGAYVRERGRAQNLRFNVDVDVERLEHVPQHMPDVLSYDVITDGIRLMVASQYFAFVETLAERVAALVLSQPRVVRVRVRIEKLDLGPGSVGVEIVRERG